MPVSNGSRLKDVPRKEARYKKYQVLKLTLQMVNVPEIPEWLRTEIEGLLEAFITDYFVISCDRVTPKRSAIINLCP